MCVGRMCHSEMSKQKSKIALGDVNDVMHLKRAWRILGGLKKVELSFASGEDGWLLGLAEARPVALCRVRTWFGADGKVSIERMCITLLMSKNL